MQQKAKTVKRLNKPQHVRQLLAEQLNILRIDHTLDPIQRARTIAYLSSVVLTAMRDGEIEERISELEKRLRGERK